LDKENMFWKSLSKHCRTGNTALLLKFLCK